MSRQSIAAYILALAVLFGGSLTAYASTGLTVQPVKISYTLTPGQTVSGTILLTNQSDEAVSVETHVEDFVPLAGADTLQFVDRAPGVTSVKDWVTLGQDKPFIFEQGKSTEIPYTIKVPDNAEPGSHFGVAFFKATKVSELQSQLKIGTQLGVLIFVTIPGNHQQNGRILDFTAPKFQQTGPVPFTMHFENTGTVHFEPKGEIAIKNMFGKQIASVPIGGEVVLPTGVKKMEFSWNVKGFVLGYYKAIANVRDGDGNILSSKETDFYVVPVWYIVGFLIALIVCYFLLRFIKRKVRISISLS